MDWRFPDEEHNMIPKNFFIGFPKAASSSLYHFLSSCGIPCTSNEEDSLFAVSKDLSDPFLETALFPIQHIQLIRQNNKLSQSEFINSASIFHPFYIYMPSIIRTILSRYSETRFFIVKRDSVEAALSQLNHRYSWMLPMCDPIKTIETINVLAKVSERDRLQKFLSICNDFQSLNSAETQSLSPLLYDYQIIEKAYFQNYNLRLEQHCFVYDFAELTTNQEKVAELLRRVGLCESICDITPSLPRSNAGITGAPLIVTQQITSDIEVISICKKISETKLQPISSKHVFYKPTEESKAEIINRVNYCKAFMEMKDEFKEALGAYFY